MDFFSLLHLLPFILSPQPDPKYRRKGGEKQVKKKKITFEKSRIFRLKVLIPFSEITIPNKQKLNSFFFSFFFFWCGTDLVNFPEEFPTTSNSTLMKKFLGSVAIWSVGRQVSLSRFQFPPAQNFLKEMVSRFSNSTLIK